MSIDHYDYKWWQQVQQAYQMPENYGQTYRQQVQSSAAALREQHDIWMQRMTGIQAALPREAPSIEEPRKVLELGDRINSGDLLAPGMRISVATLGLYVVKKRLACAWSVGEDGQQIHDASWGQPDTLSVYFAGWADKDKAQPTPPPRALVGIDFGYEPPVVVTVPRPRALPFRRHPKCEVEHDALAERNCLECEKLILVSTKKLDDARIKPARPEPHTLAPSGMCGPIMGRRR